MALIAAVPACGFPRPAHVPEDGNLGPDRGDVDASNDDGSEAGTSFCYGSFARVCFPTALTNVVFVQNSIVVDTDGSSMCDMTHDRTDRYCMIPGASFTISAGASLRAYGSKPLVLISANTSFDLSGVIDVSSKSGDPGAGANSAECGMGANATVSSGGFGGSFAAPAVRVNSSRAHRELRQRRWPTSRRRCGVVAVAGAAAAT